MLEGDAVLMVPFWIPSKSATSSPPLTHYCSQVVRHILITQPSRPFVLVPKEVLYRILAKFKSAVQERNKDLESQI